MPPGASPGAERTPGASAANTSVVAVTAWPEIFARSVPGVSPALKIARPVISVVTFCPPGSSTAISGSRRPRESSTASVACAPATTFAGRMIWRGTGVGRGFAVCFVAASAGQTTTRRPKARKRPGNRLRAHARCIAVILTRLGGRERDRRERLKPLAFDANQ